MKIKFIISFNIFITFLAGINLTFAQNAHFITSGVVEFQKSANMYAIFKKQINSDNESFYQPIYDQYIKNQPQFRKMASTLNFADDKTLYTPTADENAPSNFFGNIAMVEQNNTIFTNLQTGTFVDEKHVFDDVFLVRDSTRKIKWKITDETREIAGFTCRRANAVVLDSVYVVGFYTEKIPVSGGPESFSGLPGMILGLALPHENITWFATKVTESVVDDKALSPPKKGKPVDNKELNRRLSEATKSWGVWKLPYLKAFSL